MIEPRKLPNHEYSVELRFYGENLVVSDVTAKLDLAPTNFFSLGMEHPSSRKPTPFWGYDAQPNRDNYRMWLSLEEGFEFVCHELHARKTEIIQLSKEYRGIWWCGHFQSSFDGGPTLSPAFLAEIASYELPVFLDTYSVSGGHEK